MNGRREVGIGITAMDVHAVYPVLVVALSQAQCQSFSQSFRPGVDLTVEVGVNTRAEVPELYHSNLTS